MTGRTAQVPAYTGPLVAVGVDETVDHPEYDSVAPVNLTALRYGRWSAGVGTRQRGRRPRRIEPHARLGNSAGLGRAWRWCGGGGGSVAGGVRVDIEESSADGDSDGRRATPTPRRPRWWWSASPTDLAELTGTTPANADDLGSSRCGSPGPKVYPTTAASPRTCSRYLLRAVSGCFRLRCRVRRLIDPAVGGAQVRQLGPQHGGGGADCRQRRHGRCQLARAEHWA